MHQSTTAYLSKTIWPRWASTQFPTLSIVQTLLPVTFGYSLSPEAFVMRQLRRWKSLWRRALTRSHKRTSMGPCWSFWNGTTSGLQPEEITLKGLEFHVCTVNKIVHIRKKVWKLIEWSSLSSSSPSPLSHTDGTKTPHPPSLTIRPYRLSFLAGFLDYI